MSVRQFFRIRGMNFKTILYLAVSIISMLCGTVVLFITGSQFTETIESHNQGILQSYESIIDQQMQEIPLLTYELYTDTQIQELAGGKGDHEGAAFGSAGSLRFVSAAFGRVSDGGGFLYLYGSFGKNIDAHRILRCGVLLSGEISQRSGGLL